MKPNNERLCRSVKILERNIETILTIREWVEELEFTSPKTFSTRFRNFFGIRPKKVMINWRLWKAVKLLAEQESLSCYGVARKVGLKGEKSLYSFTRRHLDLGPRAIRDLPASEQQEMRDDLRGVKNQVVKKCSKTME